MRELPSGAHQRVPCASRGSTASWIPLATVLLLVVAVAPISPQSATAASPSQASVTQQTAAGDSESAGDDQDGDKPELDPDDPEVRRINSELELLRDRMLGLEAELQRLAGDRASVVREFEAADVELALRRQQLAILERRGDLLREERERQEQQVADLEAELAALHEDLRRRVVSLYRMGPLSYGRMLVGARDAADVLVGYQLVTHLASRDRALLEQARATLLELDAARSTLDETSARLASVRDDTAAAASALESQQRQRRALLRQLDREAESRRIALDNAATAEKDLEMTLERLAEKAAAAAMAPDVPVFAAARGELPWPADGAVISGFGRQRHPIYDTYTISRGIEIGADEGTPVRSVHAGRIVFADWYRGYGLLVILDHGGEYFTLYGHLRRIDVRVGRSVGPGEQLGEVGETASLTGPNLYFEVRERTFALDPLEWLREPSSPRE